MIRYSVQYHVPLRLLTEALHERNEGMGKELRTAQMEVDTGHVSHGQSQHSITAVATATATATAATAAAGLGFSFGTGCIGCVQQ
jgi:hypothetical protein